MQVCLLWKFETFSLQLPSVIIFLINEAPSKSYTVVIKAVSWEKDDIDSSHLGCEREINTALPQPAVVSKNLMSNCFLFNCLINNIEVKSLFHPHYRSTNKIVMLFSGLKKFYLIRNKRTIPRYTYFICIIFVFWF